MDDLDRARDLVGLGQAMSTLTVGRVSADDVYRAALVQAVSALDHYFHGVVIDRAVGMICGRISTTGSESMKVGLSFESVREIVHALTPVDQEIAARKHAASRLARETLQSPDSIASALSFVGVPGIWPLAFNKSAGAWKATLGTIVTRRNRIVHQSDGDPLNPGVPTPITPTDALDAIGSVRTVIATFDPHL
ncbi:hypothetical protein [Microbacterium sp. J1-1]|uniref:hypothetical protein n=1 Tax=Microbacterium sp. J1-1 TaxID=2992441 RepID=UPI002113F19C|nr:hypothetical protein [Microbacterium sp. J1-1]UUE20442.1 hypothetical protein LRQ07_16860 [Microbacterium sp. J1-1]